MSGQDYVYIVWSVSTYFNPGTAIHPMRIVGTAPTKYQARQIIGRQTPGSATYRIQRWRHGDSEGHWCE